MELANVINSLEVNSVIHVSMEELEQNAILVQLVSLDQIVKHVLVKMAEFVHKDWLEMEHALVFQDFQVLIVEQMQQEQLQQEQLEIQQKQEQLELKIQQLSQVPAVQHPSSFLEFYL